MRTLNDYFITSAYTQMYQSASSTFVCVPDGGRIIKIITHNKATTTGTAAISFEIGGVAVTDGGMSHVATASAGKVQLLNLLLLKQSRRRWNILNVSQMVVQQFF